MARMVSNFSHIMAAVNAAGEAALLQTAQDIYDVSQQLVPVDTSSLKLSGGVEVVDSTTVRVGYGVEGVFIAGREPSKYARFVEYGTENSAAQPYLTPATAQAEQTFRLRLEEKLGAIK